MSRGPLRVFWDADWKFDPLSSRKKDLVRKLCSIEHSVSADGENSNNEGGRSHPGQDAAQCDDQRHQRQAPDKDAEIAEVYPLCHS